MDTKTKERPTIFNAEMVRAILNGRKTQTRRVLRDQSLPLRCRHCDGRIYEHKGYPIGHALVECPYGEKGEHLWVREAFFYEWPTENPPDDMRECRIVYRADEPNYITDEMREAGSAYRWSPSIFMPRWASRIMLEIAGVRVEQVQAISEKDAIAEGWPRHLEVFPTINAGFKAQTWFRKLWDSINAKRGFGWDANPWVWVIEFHRR